MKNLLLLAICLVLLPVFQSAASERTDTQTLFLHRADPGQNIFELKGVQSRRETTLGNVTTLPTGNLVTTLENDEDFMTAFSASIERGVNAHTALKAGVKYETWTSDQKITVNNDTQNLFLSEELKNSNNSGLRSFFIEMKFGGRKEYLNLNFGIPVEYVLLEHQFESTGFYPFHFDRWIIGPYFGFHHDFGPFQTGFKTTYNIRSERKAKLVNPEQNVRVMGGNELRFDYFLESSDLLFNPGLMMSYIVPQNYRVSYSNNSGQSYGPVTLLDSERTWVYGIYAEFAVFKDTVLLPSFQYYTTNTKALQNTSLREYSRTEIALTLRSWF